jgi:hypothetical protein
MGDNHRVPMTSLEDDVTTRPVDEPDAVCAAAVDLARRAAESIADPGQVGDHLGVRAEGDRAATHLFASLSKGYLGWQWAVTVARAPRARTATVSETVLVPGAGAVLPPAWVPWSQRLAPGDLGATDGLPYRDDDPYLEPGYVARGEEEEDRTALWELGLGRVRVLSPEGRRAAAARWYLGDRGPTAEEAVHAAAACSTCGYFMALGGTMRQVFGVCANEWSPSDGRVVSVDHGCGAHSETDVERPEPEPLPEPILDETGAEFVDVTPRVAEADPVAELSLEITDEATADPAADALTDPAAPEAGEAIAQEAVAAEVPVDPAVDLFAHPTAGHVADPSGDPTASHAGEPASDPGPEPAPRTGREAEHEPEQ